MVLSFSVCIDGAFEDPKISIVLTDFSFVQQYNARLEQEGNERDFNIADLKGRGCVGFDSSFLINVE